MAGDLLAGRQPHALQLLDRADDAPQLAQPRGVPADLRVPLDLGDIDYRFAVTAMVKAGYQGYMAIEGANTGDQLTQDRRGAEYAKMLMAEAE